MLIFILIERFRIVNHLVSKEYNIDLESVKFHDDGLDFLFIYFVVIYFEMRCENDNYSLVLVDLGSWIQFLNSSTLINKFINGRIESFYNISFGNLFF